MTAMTAAPPSEHASPHESPRRRSRCASLRSAARLRHEPAAVELTATELAEAQTFPYFRVYWVGRSFDGRPLAAADGLKGYIDKVGDSVYYGDCVNSKGILGGGNCLLPLQVTTVIYALHSNTALGAQHNIARARRARDRLRRRPRDRDLQRQGRHRHLLRHLRTRARRQAMNCFR